VLGRQERQVERARAPAGDLARGLMTSLQLLLVEADHLREGQTVAVDRIREPVMRMRAVIEHQLARARAQTGAQARGREAPVAASVDALARVLGSIAAGRGITLESAVAPEPAFAGDAADLEEMLGNLLDNACKWARTRVRVAAEAEQGQLRVTVEDDRPGLEEAQSQAVFARGARLDQRMPGSGLGLAIARDLAEIYGGRIELGRSPLGGLAATLLLPGTNAAFRSHGDM
jgi:signal transduction histidine kinase